MESKKKKKVQNEYKLYELSQREYTNHKMIMNKATWNKSETKLIKSDRKIRIKTYKNRTENRE